MRNGETDQVNRLLNEASSQPKQSPKKKAPPKTAAPPVLELLDRQPPSDLEAERAVLCCCLLDCGKIPAVLDIIGPSDFYSDRHSTICGHMAVMVQEGGPVDAVLLAQSLKGAGEFDEVGGAAYLAEIIQSTAVAVHAVYYAEIVAELARRREFILALVEGIKSVYSGQKISRDVTDRLGAAIAELVPETQRTFDDDLEARLLCALSKSEDATVFMRALDEGDFRRGAHETIFRAIKALSLGRSKLDCPAALASLAVARWPGDLEAIKGGQRGLEQEAAAIFARRVKPESAGKYATAIRELRIKREKGAAIARIADAASKDAVEWLDVVAGAAKEFRTLIGRAIP